MIAGVCGGIASYFNIDPTIVRLLAVVALVSTWIGVFAAYIVLAIVLPEEPEEAAAGAEAGEGGMEADDGSGRDRSRIVLGLALAALGGFLLFERFFRWMDLTVVAALGLVGLGAYILLKGDN